MYTILTHRDSTMTAEKLQHSEATCATNITDGVRFQSKQPMGAQFLVPD